MDAGPPEAPDFASDVSFGQTPDPRRPTGSRSESGPGSGRPAGPSDASIRRTWWLLAGAFLILSGLAMLRLAIERQPVDWLVLVAVVVAAIAAIGHRNAAAGLEARRRAEAESYARILRGLARSVSADSIVGAIMDDLVGATGADHVALVRRRADGSALDATLVTGRPGIPPTTTPLPIADLEAAIGPRPGSPRTSVPLAIGVATAVPAREPVGAAPVATVQVGRATAERVAGPPALAERRASAAALLRPAASAPAPAGDAALVIPPGDRAAQIRRVASMAARESVALLRDLGLPLPSRGAAVRGVAAAEVLGTGLDASVTERLSDRVRASFGLAGTLAAPIRTDQGLIGAIVLSRRNREAWPDSARRLLSGAARETAAALERATTLREAETLASTDPLTGLPNRRYFEEFSNLLARRRRSGDAVAALMIDIDHFKRLNETYGHPVGDVVLKRVAQAIATTVREEDVPARVGGEEFAVLLRNPGPSVAAEVGERVRLAVRGLDLADTGVDRVSVSVGVANARGADEPIADLVERADEALRKAKRSGRDQVVSAT